MILENLQLIALLFILCAICQWIAWRVRMPAILFLLLTGIAAGPVFGLVQPDMILGDLLFPFVSLSVAIILFEGSLTLNFREISGLHSVVRNMVSSGMLATWLVVTLATRFVLGISWEVATLFGAIMVVTGPTVVAPILRTVRPIPSISNILKWESIVIDPIGASLAVLVYEFIISGGDQGAVGHTFVTFGKLLLTGTVIGGSTGYLFGLSLRYRLIPEFLQNISTLGLVFGSFALSNSFQPESGLVTVTVFGIWLANMKDVDLTPIIAFKKTLSILLISLLFIILAARLDFNSLQQLGWKALLICLIIQFLARPLSIMIATLRSSLGWAERHFLAWIAPRGIVAAAISSLFALKLEGYGYEDASLLVPLTFMVIIFTVILQSVTAVPVARLLKVNLPDPQGFLIIGGNRVARTIAKSLLDCGVKVRITDNSKERITKSESEGIPTYLGSPLSEHAEYNLELLGLGTLLALSAHESDNIAATFHYSNEFGKNNIYALLPTPQTGSSSKIRTMPRLRGRTLFSKKIGYARLARMIEAGASVHSFTLAGKFDHEDFYEKHNGNAVPLFGVDPKKQVHCFTPEHPPQADKGWQVLYLGFEREKSDSP